MTTSQPEHSSAIARWLDGLRARSGLVVERIASRDCRDWILDDRGWRHRTGGFFSVVGIRCVTAIPHLRGVESPMIAQSEVGVLGFVVRRSPVGVEWLVQGKTEPGNVFGTQAAPSVQATVSNYLRVHGGLETPLIAWFVAPVPGSTTLVDVTQSEQGYCFLGKYNRNVVVEVTAAFMAPAAANWAWFSTLELKEALTVDFTVNTDARSVLACADWDMFSEEGRAFSRWRGQAGFGAALLDSYEYPSEVDAIVAQLESKRAATKVRLEPVALRNLLGWSTNDGGVFPETAGSWSSVHAFSVSVADREVPTWCQPLMVGSDPVRIVLLCATVDGVLRFLLRFSVEPGFAEHVQFGPSYIGDERFQPVEWVMQALADAASVLQASVQQSDEGGRFADSIARYEIVEVAAGVIAPRMAHVDGVWVTLSELKAMTARSGLLTNEARSALSLLLTWG